VFAVELFFDAAGEARERELWARLQAAGLPSRLLTEGHMPHVSLACTLDLGLAPAQLAAALPICVGAGLPIEVVAESVALVVWGSLARGGARRDQANRY
jgi:hypothetical protein